MKQLTPDISSSMLLLLILSSAYASSLSFLPEIDESWDFIPMFNYNGSYYIKMQSPIGTEYNVYPVLALDHNILNLQCGEMAIFNCPNCSNSTNIVNHTLPFLNVSGTQSFGNLSALGGNWGSANTSFIYSNDCAHTKNSNYLKQLNLISGMIGLKPGTDSLSPNFTQFTIYLRESTFAQGFIVNGFDPKLTKYATHKKVVVNSPHGDWSFDVSKTDRSGLVYDNKTRKAYFDVSTPFIWMPNSMLEVIIEDIKELPGILCQKIVNSKTGMYHCDGKVKDFPTIKIHTSNGAQIKIPPYLYLAEKNVLQILGYADEGDKKDPDLVQFNAHYDGSIVLGSVFFEYYIGEFDATTQQVAIYPFIIASILPNSWLWLWIGGAVLLLTIYVLGRIFIQYKKHQRERKKIQDGDESISVSKLNQSTEGSLRESLTNAAH